MKWGLTFQELDKPMVLNTTNLNLCAKACGSDDTDDWFGHQVILYEDPSVSFGGKIVGGIRVKSSQKTTGPTIPQKKNPVKDKPAQDY